MSTRREFLRRTAATSLAAAATMPLARAADSTTASKGQTNQPAAGSYAARLQAALAATGVTGASFAYWDGKTLHTATAGLRNSVTRDPVTVDTVMHVGSITKVLNTTLMMQLVDEGKIALDDPVSKHVPELRLRDMQALKRITCAMLVNHTSGINCDWLPEYGPDQERIVDSINRCADLEQLHAPGEATSYCNMATVIAGYLTQKLRGKSWYTLVRARIYEPLGLTRALVDPLDVPRFRASIGDLTGPDGKMVQTTRPFLAPSFAPAGSTQMMTATDLVTFARALLNGGMGLNGKRILSAASATKMMQPTASFVPMLTSSSKIGLGWMISPGGLLHHGGGGPGVSSLLFAHPASGRAIALLTNCDKTGALRSGFLDPILESWTGIKPKAPKRLTTPIDLKPYEGAYESNLQRAEVVARNGALAMTTRVKMDLYDSDKSGAAPPTLLYPVGDDGFQGDAEGPGRPATEVRFVKPGSDGRRRFLASGFRLLARV